MQSRPATSTSESTPLVSGSLPPTYVYHANRIRQHKQRIRQFQCCICATLVGIFVLALVISISFTLNAPAPNSTNIPNGTINNLTLPSLLTPSSKNDINSTIVLSLSDEDLNSAGEAGENALLARDHYETSVNFQPLIKNSPSYRHQKSVPTTSRAIQLSRAGYASDYATKEIMRRNNITLNAASRLSFQNKSIHLNASWWPDEYCSYLNSNISNTTCGWNKYRTIDGSCNNVVHKNKWGTAYTPFIRALPAVYDDGISSPRKAVDGSDLPSARDISVIVHRPSYQDDPKFTVMLAVWGQFMDHDVTATALSQSVSGSPISCCNYVETPGLVAHPECFPVRFSTNDPYYSKFNISCTEFVRSAAAPTCSLGPREQLNQVSAYLDGSTVYGSNTGLMNKLRSFKNGTMKTFKTTDNRELLPISDDPNDGCNRDELNKQGRYCFLAGDARANENLHLTTMHLLWVRQHNKIAKELHELNPQWSDEILYQEARRIVAAQMQHITYNEFLSVVLGPKLMTDMELYSNNNSYYDKYNSSMDASIANEFASSVFRFAHTLLPTLMKSLANDTSSPEYIEMHKMLFNPYQLYNVGGMDSALRGATLTNVEAIDPYFSKEFKQHLFERDSEMKDYVPKSKQPTPCGLDLVTLNIQRGRDHGLAPYPEWREYCDLTKPKSFEDLNGIFDNDSISRISSIYKDVNDIDLYTGALSEFPRKGGIIGETATCLILDQFIRLKRGDRFWYETSEQPQAFTLEQLNEIRKTTLARIICDNSDNITRIQPHVMINPKFENAIVSCTDIPNVDLKYWKTVPKIKLTSSLPQSNIRIITS